MAKVVALDDAPRRTRRGRPVGTRGLHIARIKRRLAFLVALGRPNRVIAREFEVTSRTVRTWLDHPQVQEAIREVEEELYHRAEKRMFRLFLTSIGRMEKIIRHADDKSALRAVELLWEAHGRLPRGRGREQAAPGADTYNQPQVNVMSREEAKAAMSLLLKERDRLEREKLEQRDPPAE